MSYNPPELKQEMQDTLYCLGVDYEYETIKNGSMIVRAFHLKKTDTYVDIYGVNSVRYKKKKMSMREAKLALMSDFLVIWSKELLKMSNLNLSDEEYQALQERNAARAKEQIEKMGSKYLCHPDNQITKRKFKRTLKKSRALQLNCT